MKRLVVARHEENIDWVKHMPLDWEIKVVQKGDHVPNEGREAASYCWAFKKMQGVVPDDAWIACVQGDPFQHSQSFVRWLYREPKGYTPLPSWEAECDGEGAPHHKGLPVKEKFEEWFGKPFPGLIAFMTGAQFMVRGSDLRGKDWDVWYSRACEEHGPWLLERFWREVFR